MIFSIAISIGVSDFNLSKLVDIISDALKVNGSSPCFSAESNTCALIIPAIPFPFGARINAAEFLTGVSALETSDRTELCGKSANSSFKSISPTVAYMTSAHCEFKSVLKILFHTQYTQV